MNAIQPSRPPHPPQEPARQRVARTRPITKKHPHRATTIELSVKLAVNAVLSVAAIGGLIKLIPHNLSHQEQLGHLNHEVAQTEQRMEALRADFNRSFDPQQTRSVMQEQSNRVNVGQRRVVWVTPPEGTTLSQQPRP